MADMQSQKEHQDGQEKQYPQLNRRLSLISPSCSCPIQGIHSSKLANTVPNHPRHLHCHDRDHLHTSYLGTVRYVGDVPPTKGLWFGVEWDNHERGKHNGVYDKTGREYFKCRIHGAGTFLRPNASGISFGTSFHKAVQYKYLEDETNEEAGRGADNDPISSKAASIAPPNRMAEHRFSPNSLQSTESTFYATNSNFKIEVTPLSRVRDRFKQLQNMREMGLEWAGVNGAGTEDEMARSGRELSQLKALNLSYNLIPTWTEVSRLLQPLQNLSFLVLNSNRFERLTQTSSLIHYEAAFGRLTELHLNQTLMVWEEMTFLASSLHLLKVLQFADNFVDNLSSSVGDGFKSLEVLNLQHNLLSDWDQISRSSLKACPSLTSLNLGGNRLELIAKLVSPENVPMLHRRIRHLDLSENLISTWSSVDHLTSFTDLQNLRFSGNPLIAGLTEQTARQLIIARIPTLNTLEGTPIPDSERDDAELFYISLIQKKATLPLREKWVELDHDLAHHPRFEDLLKKHERFYSSQVQINESSNKSATKSIPAAGLDTQGGATKAMTIGNKLMKIHVLVPLELCSDSVSSSKSKSENFDPHHDHTHSQPDSFICKTISVLPNSSTRVLRRHMSRLLRIEIREYQWRCVALLGGGKLPREKAHDNCLREDDLERVCEQSVEEDSLFDPLPTIDIPSDEEDRPLSWWGLEAGDHVKLVSVV